MAIGVNEMHLGCKVFKRELNKNVQHRKNFVKE